MLNFNVGYHNEHHDFPDIPGSKLPELHRIAKDHYGTLQSGNSWLKSIWQFITDPAISAYSRIIRTSEVQKSTNNGLATSGLFKNRNGEESHQEGHVENKNSLWRYR